MKIVRRELIDITVAMALSIGLLSAPAKASDAISEAQLYTVKILTAIEYPFGSDTKGSYVGAGFLVDQDRGWIVTNAHVVGRSPSKLKVSWKNQSYVHAEKVYIDNHLDLAVIKVDPKLMPVGTIGAQLGCGADFKPGAQVIAFGHPWSIDYTATRGIISGTTIQRGSEYLQTDAALNPGNSGGPLIEMSQGQVIAVNSSGLQKSKSEGMNFAIPVEFVCTILDLLRAGKDPAPPILPIQFATTLKNNELVIALAEGAWAQELKIGDRVDAINGNTKINSVSRVLDEMRGKKNVDFQIDRMGKKIDVALKVPEAKDRVTRLGVQVSGMTVGRSTIANSDPDEMLIQYIADASEAEQSGFSEGDIIVAIDGEKVRGHAALLKSIELSVGRVSEFVVKRERREPGRYVFLLVSSLLRMFSPSTRFSQNDEGRPAIRSHSGTPITRRFGCGSRGRDRRKSPYYRRGYD